MKTFRHEIGHHIYSQVILKGKYKRRDAAQAKTVSWIGPDSFKSLDYQYVPHEAGAEWFEVVARSLGNRAHVTQEMRRYLKTYSTREGEFVPKLFSFAQDSLYQYPAQKLHDAAILHALFQLRGLDFVRWIAVTAEKHLRLRSVPLSAKIRNVFQPDAIPEARKKQARQNYAIFAQAVGKAVGKNLAELTAEAERYYAESWYSNY